MDSEAVPLTNCEAMYQAAVSKRADNTFPSGVLQCVHGHELFPLQWVATARAACTEKSFFLLLLLFATIGADFQWSLKLVCLYSLCMLSIVLSKAAAGHLRLHRSYIRLVLPLLLLVPSCSIYGLAERTFVTEKGPNSCCIVHACA